MQRYNFLLEKQISTKGLTQQENFNEKRVSEKFYLRRRL